MPNQKGSSRAFRRPWNRIGRPYDRPTLGSGQSVGSPLSPRTMISWTRIARSTAARVKAITTSWMAISPRRRGGPSGHVTCRHGRHMLCSLHKGKRRLTSRRVTHTIPPLGFKLPSFWWGGTRRLATCLRTGVLAVLIFSTLAPWAFALSLARSLLLFSVR